MAIRRRIRSKTGQMTLSFNWIFVLIAGFMILLFFVSIIMKQKTISEQKLNFDVINVMNSILTGSSVSERTINFVDISGISEFEIFFQCEIDGGGFKDIFSEYGIVDAESRIELPIQAIFALKTIQGTEMITWSLPYNIPYKVMDALIVTSTSNKYYVLGGEGSELRKDLENATTGFNIEFISDISEVAEAGDAHHIRIIDLTGNSVSGSIPDALLDIDDSKVSAVSLGSSLNNIKFYQKKGSSFQITHTEAESIPIIMTGDQEKDPALYGALFSYDDDSYKCSMMKLFKRYQILSEIYQGKTSEMIAAYEGTNGNDECMLYLQEGFNGKNLEDSLSNLNSELSTCLASGYDTCTGLSEIAKDIQELNQGLASDNCEKLY